jgi:hypothetical protein
VLLAELLWLASRFTTATLPASNEDWVRLVRLAPCLPQIGLAVLTSFLLFRREESSDKPRRIVHGPRSRTGLIAVALGQLGAFAMLVDSTAGIFEKHLAGVEYPLLAIAIWWGLALAADWRGFTRRARMHPQALRGRRSRSQAMSASCRSWKSSRSAGT